MKYVLGLDIGITSIGWSVLDYDREKIADLGVRLFPGAENPKDGASLAKPRREARSARRRTRRKRQRISAIKELIVRSGIITKDEMKALYERSYNKTPWQLRFEALDRILLPEEFARTLVHLAKHRGFRSNRNISADESTQNKTEEGRALAGMNANRDLLINSSYRTVGEMVYCDDKFAEHKRNKGGDYTNTLLRADVESEVRTIFAAQRRYNNPFASQELEDKYIEIFNRQLPFASGEEIEKKVGYCKLEPTCKRAPKASFTAERFILLSKIANLRVCVNGKKCELSSDKRKIVDELAYKNAKVTYKQIRKAFNSSDEWYFDSIPKSKKSKDPEDAVFIELKAFHSFRKAITGALGKEYWNTLITTTPEKLDALACALTFRKTDSDITEYLREYGVDEELINAVLPMNFSGCVNLSLEAMRKIIPFMEEKCARYDEACEMAGYSHYAPSSNNERFFTLPVPDWDEIRNPVIVRAVAQVRKVINAIVHKYGSPTCVHIELARDLSHSFKERKEIEKEQEENRTAKEKLAKEFKDAFEHEPNGRELDKYRLWKEQSGFCPYSGEYIDPQNAFMGQDGNYAEIDHIVPYSRSFDDSFVNKVLVIGSENRNKKERTPYEYFGGEGEKWEAYIKRVDSYIKNYRKASRLKVKVFDEEEMKDRSLNDTRYITRFIANWIENTLIFADAEIKRPVLRINGRATAYLRRRWGLNKYKDRTANDLHHALDACVIAAATPALVKRVSDYSKMKETGQNNNEKDKVKFPQPWECFRDEVAARIGNAPAQMAALLRPCHYTNEELDALKPIFVSRAPDRKAKGAAHEETIRSARYIDEGKTAVKKSLTKINLSTLEEMVGKERDRSLYNALKKRLEENDNDPAKSFKEPFYKPLKNGGNGPLVRSIKIFETGIAGVRVCNGIASNGGMVRVDVYRRDGKYFIVPYYVADIAKGIVKNSAIVAYKPQSEWTKIDKSFDYVHSLYKNDLIKVIVGKGEMIFGYYTGCNIKTGAISIEAPSGDKKWSSIGLKTAKVFEKYEVGILGDYHKIEKEKPLYELA